MRALLYCLNVIAVLLLGYSPAVASSRMKTGEITTVPVGHYDYCRRYPRECTQNKPSFQVKLGDVWELLNEVNTLVNTLITPIDDIDLWGMEEFWEYPHDLKGECEEYVLMKRRMLIEAGIPANALLITVVFTTANKGHGVLTVVTNRGDFILDNISPRIVRWDQTLYWYFKRQSRTHQAYWESVVDTVHSNPGEQQSTNQEKVVADMPESPEERKARLIATPHFLSDQWTN
jgi:predicted transglutaminase-like cysteine proteinase